MTLPSSSAAPFCTYGFWLRSPGGCGSLAAPERCCGAHKPGGAPPETPLRRELRELRQHRRKGLLHRLPVLGVLGIEDLAFTCFS